METIIGFVIGYAVGIREGQAGFEKARAALRDIATSPELRRMIAETAATAAPIARKLAGDGATALFGRAGGRVVDLVAGAADRGKHVHAA
jgi:basic membrane lipoprotein Med (substrate-binding protein (PBP1-ABC) superfamily)